MDDSENIVRLKTILAYLQSSQMFPETLIYYLRRYPHPQKHLARSLNVDTSAITHWRRNRRMPQDSAMIYRLACELGLGPREKQRFLMAWLIQRTYKDMVDYYKIAIERGDDIDFLLDSVTEFLNGVLGSIDELNSEEIS